MNASQTKPKACPADKFTLMCHVLALKADGLERNFILNSNAKHLDRICVPKGVWALCLITSRR